MHLVATNKAPQAIKGCARGGINNNNNNNNLNIFIQDCCFSFKKKTAINAGPVKN